MGQSNGKPCTYKQVETTEVTVDECEDALDTVTEELSTGYSSKLKKPGRGHTPGNVSAGDRLRTRQSTTNSSTSTGTSCFTNPIDHLNCFGSFPMVRYEICIQHGGHFVQRAVRH